MITYLFLALTALWEFHIDDTIYTYNCVDRIYVVLNERTLVCTTDLIFKGDFE